MIRFFSCLLLSMLTTGTVAHAAAAPPKLPASSVTLDRIMNMPLSELERLTGRKFTLHEKMQMKVVQLRHRLSAKFEDGVPTPKQHKQGRLASTFGGIAVLIILIGATGAAVPGVIVLLTLPLGIAALILGIKSVKGNGNAAGIVGIVTGAIVTFIWLIALIAVAIILSSI